MIKGDDVVLRPTTADDLELAASLFRDPGFLECWGGVAKSDEEIVAKYLGARRPEVECFSVEVDGRIVGFNMYHDADDGGEGVWLIGLIAISGEQRGTPPRWHEWAIVWVLPVAVALLPLATNSSPVDGELPDAQEGHRQAGVPLGARRAGQ